MQTSSLHVFDPKNRVLVTCVSVFYTGRCRKMACARCSRDIWPRLDVRETLERYSMYGGHLDATRCAGDIWTLLDVRGTSGRYSMYAGHLDATRCTGDTWTLLDERGTFGRYLMYAGRLDAIQYTGDIWTLLDVRGTSGRDSMYGGHVIVVRYSVDILWRLSARRNLDATRCAATFWRDSVKNGDGNILTRLDVLSYAWTKYLCLTAAVFDGRH